MSTFITLNFQIIIYYTRISVQIRNLVMQILKKMARLNSKREIGISNRQNVNILADRPKTVFSGPMLCYKASRS